MLNIFIRSCIVFEVGSKYTFHCFSQCNLLVHFFNNQSNQNIFKILHNGISFSIKHSIENFKLYLFYIDQFFRSCIVFEMGGKYIFSLFSHCNFTYEKKTGSILFLKKFTSINTVEPIFEKINLYFLRAVILYMTNFVFTCIF